MSDKANHQDFLSMFSDPQAVSRYAEGPRRYVPGLADLHRMTGLLLAERAPTNARILVLGAGGGLELEALTTAYPDWTFVGVDPSAEMLSLAARTLEPVKNRVDLIRGYIEDAPPGPFDGATCLLTLHFLDAATRRRTVNNIHSRLKPGAAFVTAHGSFPQEQNERSTWLARYSAFAISSGVDPTDADRARAMIDSGINISILSPTEDQTILRESGFTDASLFFAAFTWRGWVAHA